MRLPFIHSVSTVNLRLGRGVARRLDEPIPFSCDICGKSRRLGCSSSVLVRVQYTLREGGVNERSLCDRCMDVFADVLRFGPRVLSEASVWERKSLVARVSHVQGELFCFKCMSKGDSHLFVKFDDLSAKKLFAGHAYDSVRVCARCACTYLLMLEAECIMSDKKNRFVLCAGEGSA